MTNYKINNSFYTNDLKKVETYKKLDYKIIECPELRQPTKIQNIKRKETREIKAHSKTTLSMITIGSETEQREKFIQTLGKGDIIDDIKK